MKKAKKTGRKPASRRTKEPNPPELSGFEFFAGNSHLHMHHVPDALFGPPPYILESVPMTTVGHTFGQLPPFVPGAARYLVQDFLLDQTGSSGTDGRQAPMFKFDLTTVHTYVFQLYAKTRNGRIKVEPPENAERVIFALDVGRRYVNAVSDSASPVPADVVFRELDGMDPVLTHTHLSVGHNTNHWVHFFVTGDVISTMEFSAIVVGGAYEPRSFDPGIKDYIPLSYSVPFNLSGPNGVPHMMFSYHTTSPTDPGPFVFMK